MEPVSAPGYDRFKTVVAIILAVILILMLLRGCATNPVAPASEATQVPVIATMVPILATVTFTPVPVSTETVPAATLAVETITPTASTLPPTEPPAAATVTVEGPTPTPAAAEPTATAAPTQEQDGSCNTSAPSRLAVGQNGRVLRRLNMRSDPSIQATILQTNPTGIQVQILGGPVCEPVGERAYLWWQIRLPDGAEGWSAEISQSGGTYFLEPVP